MEFKTKVEAVYSSLLNKEVLTLEDVNSIKEEILRVDAAVADYIGEVAQTNAFPQSEVSYLQTVRNALKFDAEAQLNMVVRTRFIEFDKWFELNCKNVQVEEDENTKCMY